MNKIKVNSKMINSLLGNSSMNSDNANLKQSQKSDCSKQKVNNLICN